MSDKTSDQKTTPTPWTVSGNTSSQIHVMAPRKHVYSAAELELRGYPDNPESLATLRGIRRKADARLIVRSVNSYKTSLDAMKAILKFAEDVEVKVLTGDEGCLWPVEQLRVAIRAAESEDGLGGQS